VVEALDRVAVRRERVALVAVEMQPIQETEAPEPQTQVVAAVVVDILTQPLTQVVQEAPVSS
jgi:hypothetical protein